MCLDPIDLNRAILREYHPLPVFDDIIPEMKDSNFFTKLDLKDCYWYVKPLPLYLEDTDTAGFHLVYVCHRTFSSLGLTKNMVIVKELLVS